MEEEWRTVVYNGVTYDDYEVSNLGNVRSLNYNHTGKTQVLKPRDNGKCYLQIGLHKDGKRKKCLIHRLVACTWIPNPNGYTDVDHIDNNRHNNHVDNLRWTTHKNNVVSSQAKQVICIETGQVFESTMEVERVLGLDHSSIGKCCRGSLKSCGGLHFIYEDNTR